MYKRIVLKLSGEALAGDKGSGNFDNEVIKGIVLQIKEVMAAGTEVMLVIGGGNFWRGRSANPEMDRCKADQIGMLATVMNSIYMADFLRQNGVKAVEKYQETKPDLVLMDITMPEMDGIQALKKIKAIDANASVVMCSAMGQQAMVIESIQSGARDFIVKPFQPDRVIEAVKKAVE